MVESTSGSDKPLLNNRYLKVKKLGEGSYGAVYLAIDMKPESGIVRQANPKALEMLQHVPDDSKEDAVMTDDT